MAHARQQIRAAVVTAVTGLGLTGSRVHPARRHPLEDDHDPTLLVYTGAEEISREEATQGRPSAVWRTLTLSVEGRAQDAAAADLEDTLDAIAAQVEAALGTGSGEAPLSGLVLDMELTGIEPTIDGSANSHYGAIRLDYAVVYRTAENDAETILDQ